MLYLEKFETATFYNEKIDIYGDIDNPMFLGVDVMTLIGENRNKIQRVAKSAGLTYMVHFMPRRYIRRYGVEMLAKSGNHVSDPIQKSSAHFFTEQGFYLMCLRSRSKEAHYFAELLLDKLRTVRIAEDQGFQKMFGEVEELMKADDFVWDGKISPSEYLEEKQSMINREQYDEDVYESIQNGEGMMK